jgi:hypothetical protein
MMGTEGVTSMRTTLRNVQDARIFAAQQRRGVWAPPPLAGFASGFWGSVGRVPEDGAVGPPGHSSRNGHSRTLHLVLESMNQRDAITGAV